jgi:hypothetical protein
MRTVIGCKGITLVDHIAYDRAQDMLITFDKHITRHK